MKTKITRFETLLVLLTIAVLALPWVVSAASVVNDTYADGNSQNQDLANNSIRLFNARSGTVRADAAGSVTFNITGAAGAEAFWGYFTNSGSPVNLNIGDKLTVAGTFTLTGFGNNGNDVRFGVLNSLGTRNANNFTGGMNDSTFVNDTGYALDFFPSPNGSSTPFNILRRTTLNQGNLFNSINDFTVIPGSGATVRQALTNNVAYTLTYSIERLNATDTKISVAVGGGTLNNLSFTSTESSATPNTAFDYFAFRIGGNTFAQTIKFTNWSVDYVAALPVITSQPQPNNLTVQVGSNVTMAVAASGNQLSYQWPRNGSSILGNLSATTPTLNLTNVQLGDAGSDVAVVSNPSGSVQSNPVTLNVSTDPVPPPPGISIQPADTTVAVGSPTALSVVPTGNNLFYQWF